MRSRHLAAVIVAGLIAGSAAAQPLHIPRELFDERLRREGDSLAFCVNGEAMSAGFEEALANELAAALLLSARIVRIDPPNPTPPLDYRMALNAEQIYIVLAEQCDAFMGFTLAASGYPEWMAVTRPYLRAPMVVIAAEPAYQRLEDIPLDRPIGSRSLSRADNVLLAYLMSLPDNRRWQRFPYYNHQILLDKLRDGTVAAALFWEPALYYATDGDPDAAGLHLVAFPIELPATEIGIALRSKDAFLNDALGQAIELLVSDGTVARLMAEHRLAPKAE